LPALEAERSVWLREIQAIVRAVLGDAAVSLREEMFLEEVADWDSLVQTQTVVAIEQRFNVLFDLDELAAFSTVGALLDTVQRKLRPA